jgi:formylmethanofuran dehydrogenase subunit E
LISNEDTRRIQNELGELAIASLRIDLDGFLELTELMASPQALTHGLDPRTVTSAGEWAELARLLRPFRDETVRRISQIREELAQQDDDFVGREAACPACDERRTDELALNEDGSVVCATCGRRYFLPGEGAGDA